MNLDIYADGSIIGNGQENSVGGWAAVIVMAGRMRVVSGYEFDTTNNRMELQAAIEGIRQMRSPTDITLYSDSEYVIHGFTKGRVPKNATNNWQRKVRGKGWEPVPNADLWQALANLDLYHRIEWTHEKGHTSDVACKKVHAEGGASYIRAVDNGNSAGYPGMPNIDMYYQWLADRWAATESQIAHAAREKGVTGLPLPNSLEGRWSLLQQIKELRVPPAPPVTHAPECWAVFRRTNARADSPVEPQAYFVPVEPSKCRNDQSVLDGGRRACEIAAATMNAGDEREPKPSAELKRFFRNKVKRYVVRCVSKGREKDGDGETDAAA